MVLATVLPAAMLFWRGDPLGFLYCIPGAVLAVIAVSMLLYAQKNHVRFVAQLSENSENAQLAVIDHLPFGLCVLDGTGVLVQMNPYFQEEIMDGADLFGRNLYEIIPFNPSAPEQDICWQQRYYKVRSMPYRDGDIPLNVYLWTDVPNLEVLRREHENSHPCVMLLVIDSYEDLIQNAKESERLEASFAIERLLEEFISGTNGIIRRLKNDRFIAVLEEQHIRQLIEGKFKILDDARNISIDERNTVTFSIGVGHGAQTLAEAYRDYWYTGVSVNQWQGAADPSGDNAHDVTGQVSNDQTADWPVIVENFNWVVAENCMKCEVIHPQEGVYDFTLADQFVNKAKAAGMKVMGHCLIWHSQCAPWFHYDGQGKLVSPEVLKKRMREHIFTIVSHFKGRIDAWDVVNEAFEDDGTYRQSPWYRIIGPEYVELAYRFAHEADPDAELYYNDFSMSVPAKRAAVCKMVRSLQEKGLRIDGVGMQSHNGLTWPSNEDYEASMDAFAALGVKVMITELDMNVLPNPESFSGAEVSLSFAYSEKMDPYKNGLPADVAQRIDGRWVEFFRIYKRHAHQISRVCVWGLSDGDSWMNDWPIEGRTAYPLLFDRNNAPKPVVQDIIDLYQ